VSYWSRSFRGLAEGLAEVRQYTAARLGERPGIDLVVLATSELASNAILHRTRTRPGG
jgi:anti-sigma regulatory factor (Ser/Thr protein kinase)